MKISKAMCHCALIIVLLLIWKTTAYRKTLNLNELLVEDQRTHKRQNHIVRANFDNEMLENADDIGPSYALSASFEPDHSNTEELPAQIVDYANMIRNDIILLDNSVETRTRKRAHQAIPESNCDCHENKTLITLDRYEYFPPELETRICSQKLCSKSHRCKSIEYMVTVVRKRRLGEPHQGILSPKLVSESRNVTVACLCIKDG